MSRKTGQPSGSGARELKTRVRTAKKRKVSSTRWLQRQLNDPYVKAAKEQGYRSRAAFKLAEIDDRFAILKPGLRVLDLGAAPGGWSQVAVARVGALDGGGEVVALDINEMEPLAGAQFVLLDFLSNDADQALADLSGAGRFDVVLSDMAAPATGHKQTDHIRIIGLCEAAAHFASQVLSPGGSFLAKVLQGGAVNDLLNGLKRDFAKVRHVKPKASRADSSESYVLATGFRGAAD